MIIQGYKNERTLSLTVFTIYKKKKSLPFYKRS
jgi:hypothetical protein